MESNTRRSFFGKITRMAAFLTSTPRLFAQQVPPAGAPETGSTINERKRPASTPRR